MQLWKLLMSWNIIQGREQDYIQFNAKVFVPRMMKFDLQPLESWFTIHGAGPQVSVGWVSNDVEAIRRAVNTEEWSDLLVDLDEYVKDFRYKIVPVTGRSGYQM